MKHLNFIFTILLLLSCGNVMSQTTWSVDNCMRYAMENNTQLKKQSLSVATAKSTLTERKLAFLPSISASSNLNANYGRSVDPDTNAYIDVANLSNSYGIYGELALFNGLQTVNNYKIAKISKLREDLTAEQVKNQVAIQTMSAYYKAIFAHGAYKIAADELAESRKMYDKKKVEHEVGLANISDLAQMESRVSQGEYNLTNLEGLYKKSLIELKNQMFYPLSQELAIDTLSTIPIAIIDADENFSQIYSTALSKLPDLKIVEADERIAELNLSTARGKLFPRLLLNGGVNTGYSQILGKKYDVEQDDFKMQLENRMGEYVGLSLSIPLWGGLSRRKEVQRKKYEYSRVQIVKEEKSREIEALIFEALIDLGSYEKQCNLSETNVKANTLSFRTTEAKFNEGLSTVVDMQTTQTNLSRAKIDQLKAFLNYLMQRRVVDYYKGLPLIR